MYYVINYDTDMIMKRLDHPPFQSELQDLADETGCPVYVIQGQHFGMTAYPSTQYERQAV